MISLIKILKTFLLQFFFDTWWFFKVLQQLPFILLWKINRIRNILGTKMSLNSLLMISFMFILSVQETNYLSIYLRTMMWFRYSAAKVLEVQFNWAAAPGRFRDFCLLSSAIHRPRWAQNRHIQAHPTLCPVWIGIVSKRVEFRTPMQWSFFCR